MGEYFDEQVAAYERWYTTPLGQLVDRVEKEAVFGLLPQLKGKRVLDAGSGTGNFALALARRQARVVGLDRSAAMQIAARRKAQEQGLPLLWTRGNVTHLPFTDASFEGVTCILALDFITDRQAALRELVRVLGPGGFFLLAVLNRYSLWTLKRTLKALVKPSLWRGVRFISRTELNRLIRGEPDLIKIHCGQAVFFPPWKSPRLVRYYPYLETLGKKLWPPAAAFLVVAAKKKKTSLGGAR